MEQRPPLRLQIGQQIHPTLECVPMDASDQAHFKVSSGSIALLRRDARTFSQQLAQLNDVSHLTGA